MSETDTAESRSGIQVIARAASVLRALKGARSGMSLGQIAEQVDLPRSTVQRIVGALQAERMVIASNSSGGIRLGPELQSLAESARFSVADVLRPLLVRLSAETEETVDLSSLRGNVVVFLDQIPGTQRLRAVSSVGDAFPLTTTANGKACLSLLDDETITLIARGEWAATGRKGEIADLLEEIRSIRISSIAFDRDEHTPGISAVGVAFRDWNGDIYAVSIPTPTTRFGRQEERLVAAIGKLAGEIAATIAQ
ncbi:IclR family transcriptional regulator [Mesorhizobium marinum]|uniref:IclR family transcriptional regulator n=1 Tax=Mesorhizobium marinum TaxID=3228790 RepID=A0ABV3R5W2_9HYPH